MPIQNPNNHCDGHIIHCMDYRLPKYLYPWVVQRFGYDNFDTTAIAGCTLDYEMLLKHVQLAVRVHTVDVICIVNHEDCRAYGEAGTYERHQHDLKATREKLLALFPHLQIETYYLHLDGTFEEMNSK